MVTIEDLCKGQEPKIESALANLYALGFRLAPTLKLNPRQRFVVAQVLDRSLRDVTEFAQRNRRARGDWQRVYERLRDETGQARNPEAIDEESKFLDVMRLV